MEEIKIFSCSLRGTLQQIAAYRPFLEFLAPPGRTQPGGNEGLEMHASFFVLRMIYYILGYLVYLNSLLFLYP